MTTLGIFTVKRFHLHDGCYYTYGGFGEYLAEIRKYFSRVVLVARVRRAEPPPGWYRVPGENLEIVHLPALPTELGHILTIPSMLYRSFGAIRKMDVVHARMPDYTGVIGAAVARFHGVPCFHQIVGDWEELAISVPLAKAFGLGLPLRGHLLLYDLAERRISRGQLVFAQGARAYAKHASASDCQLALSAAHRAADVVAPRERFRDEPFTILNVGRLQIEKNQSLIIRALARLNATRPQWRLVLVGQGRHEAALRALCRELGVAGQVEFAGQLDRGAQLWARYDRADVFVLSSLSEGTPKVILEAMARGVPVVASAVGGVPTAVSHEARGLLYRSDDVEALVRAVERMRDDRALRERCAAAAHDFALEHSLEAATRNMIAKVAQRWPSLGLDPHGAA